MASKRLVDQDAPMSPSNRPATEPRLVNATPHAITLVSPDGSKRELPADKNFLLRLNEEPGVEQPDAHGLPVRSEPRWTGVGPMIPLPKSPDERVDLLVSMVVGQYFREHGIPSHWPQNYVNAVYGPNTSPGSVVRGAGGQIEGTKELIRYL